MTPIKITIYPWAGKKWFLRIRRECVECDLAVGQARALLAAHPDWPVELEVKPWLSHLWEALHRGGWHPPVVLVDDRLLRQGTVPTRAELSAAVQFALALRGSPSANRRRQEEPREANAGVIRG